MDDTLRYAKSIVCIPILPYRPLKCTVKKVRDFLFPNWDVTNQTIPGREIR